MKVHDEIPVPEREDLEAIAVNLEVPERLRTSFVNWIRDLAEIMDEVRDKLNDRYEDFRTAREALKATEKALAKAGTAISGEAGYLDLVNSSALGGSLAVLLGRGGKRRLAAVTEVKFVSITARGIRVSVRPEALEDHSVCEVCEGDEAHTFDTPYQDLSRLLSVLEHLVSRELRAFRLSGGRPRDRIRTQILKELRVVYERTFGEAATTAPGGRYARLCEDVFTSYGMSTEGLEEAIKRSLRKARSDRKTK